MKSHQLREIKRVRWSKRRQNMEIDGKWTIIKHNRSEIVKMVTRKIKSWNLGDYPSKTCIHNQGPLPRWWKVSRAIRKKCYNVLMRLKGLAMGCMWNGCDKR